MHGNKRKSYVQAKIGAKSTIKNTDGTAAAHQPIRSRLSMTSHLPKINKRAPSWILREVRDVSSNISTHNSWYKKKEILNTHSDVNIAIKSKA